jgi:uncharacterized delta-60 repeat protein
LLGRFLSDGSLDTSFGTSGFINTDFAGGTDVAHSIALQVDGKIVLGGLAVVPGVRIDFALARYNSDGTLDTSFNGTGKVLTNLGVTGSDDQGRQVTLQADGKILLAGWSNAGGTTDFALVRYDTNGTLDTTFNGTGKVTTAIGTGSDLGLSVTVQSDGKILVAGQSDTAGNNFAVVRYLDNGILDTSFGAGTGKVDTPFGGSSDDRGAAVLVQPDGKIVVAGTSKPSSGDYDFAIVRYNTDGTLDTQFNTSDTLGGTVAYTEKAAPVVLDNDVVVLDAELSALNDFSGATLTLARNGGANSQDVYSASGLLAALTQGGNLVFNGATIGTVTTNSGGTLLLTFNGNATQTLVNSALRAIAYSNNSAAPPASVVVNWTFNDGNTSAQGSGGALAASGSTTVNITAVNDAPVITAPATASVAEEMPLVFSVVNANAIVISDVDAGGGLVNVVISITNGTATLATTAGIDTVSGDGTGSIDLYGTLASINTALDGLTFVGATDYDETARIFVAVYDFGNSGSLFVVLDDTHTIDVTIIPVNDAPLATADAYTVVEDETLTVAAPGVLGNDRDPDSADPAFVFAFGTPGVLNGNFSNPSGLAFDGAGNLHVADTNNHRIQVFDSAGTHLLSFGVSGTANGQFNRPSDVAVDSNGNIYVADNDNARIQKFDSAGNHLLTWGSNGTGVGQFQKPVSLAVDAANNVYVVDAWNNNVQKFDSLGNHQLTWGSYGTADGWFNTPLSIAVDANGIIWVGESGGERIQQFDTSGNHTLTFGSGGANVGKLNNPAAIAFDSDGNAYIADLFNQRVQIFDSAGNYIMDWGSSGTAAGQFQFPNSVAVDSTGRVWVADANNNRIQVFAAAETRGEPLTAVLVAGPGNASSFALNADGSFTYTPNANWNGTDGFTYTANDGALNSNVVTVSITVTAVNDAAVLSADVANLTEGNLAADISTSGTLTISDVDSAEAFIAQSGTAGSYGIFGIDTAGAWSYTASSAHDEFMDGTIYTDTFSVASADGTTTSVTINILGTNDAAQATNLDAVETYTEDSALNLIDIVINDVDSAVTATLTLSDAAAGSLNTATSGSVTSTYDAGTGVWSASGAIADVNTLLAGLSFTPALNYNGDFTIATSVSDGVAPAVTGSKAMGGTAVIDHILTVDTTSDSSDGDTRTIDTLLADRGADGFISLREAILAANGTVNEGAPDEIRFNIAGVGAHAIQLNSALPKVTDAVVIDGYSQPGTSANTLAVGTDATLLIVLDGFNAGSSTHGLSITAGGTTIRGLVINNFSYAGITLNNGDGNIIQGNYIGIDATGTIAVPNGRGTTWDGIVIGDTSSSSNNLIGGSNPADRNVLSGNNGGGIWTVASGGSNMIRGNYIGLNAAGTLGIGNQQEGITLVGPGNSVIGNVISGNSITGTYYGIHAQPSAANSTIQGNLVGLSADGTTAIGNQQDGIYLESSDNIVGGTVDGHGNVIAHNRKGVVVTAGNTGNAILGNSIYGNTNIGIDLGNHGVSGNNGSKNGSQGNYGMDFPFFATAGLSGNTLNVAGFVGSAANQATFANARVEVFKSDGDGTGYGEGRTYLGFVTTDASGNFSGSLDVSGKGLGAGDRLTGTATDGSNNTSEFGLNIVVNNDAPVLAGANNLTTINEDPSSNPGTLVSSLITALVTDTDEGAVTGIAVTAADNSNGAWQYSTDGGSGWSNFNTPSATASRLLTSNASTYVRFVPSANWNGTVAAGLTFRAWDQTTGTAGSTANTNPAGGNTAFSAATATASIVVAAVNDAPTATNLSAAQTYIEDTPLALTAIVISDVDSASVTATLTLSNIAAGALNTGSSGAVTSTYVAGAGVWTASGALADVNALLAGLTFTPALNYNADFTIATSVSDGVAAALTGSKAMNGMPIGDTPQVASMTTNEDTLSGLIVIDRNANDGAEVMHFRISGIANGALFQANGTTAISNGDFITYAQAQAGLKFTPSANSTAAGSFDVESSEDGSTVAAQSAKAISTITVIPVGDTPQVASITTDEDTQSGLIVINRNANDGTEVTHFRISGIANGALFQADGTTGIANGDFITYAQAQAGLTFTPSANSTADGTFDAESSEDGATVSAQSAKATSTITVTPVGDTPQVASITTNEDTQSGLIVINRNVNDGAEVTHFKISSIANGTLFQADGTTAIGNSDFITYVQALAGLKFTPLANSTVAGSFDVESSQDGSTVAAQSGVATSTITVNAAPILTAGATLVHSEGDAPAVIDNTITIVDVDSNVLVSATIQITGNRQAGGVDVLNKPPGGGISGMTWIPSTGTFTLIGTASVSQYQAALRTVTFVNTSDSPSTLDRTITWTVNDGLANSLPQTSTVRVNAVNDAPTLGATALNPSFTEAAGLGTQAAAVSVFSGAAVSTVESGQTITGLSFTVSGLVDGANEVVVVDGRTITLGATSSGTTVTNSLAYSSTVSTGTATIVLSGGSLSAAATQTLVNGITYQNTNTDNPTAGIRVITLSQIRDDGGAANGGEDTTALAIGSTITVNAVDDGTVISGTSSAALTETNAAQSTGGTLVATDPDSSNLFVAQSNVAGSNNYGAFSIGTDGVWTYAMNSAHDEFVAATDYIDSLTVTTADGSSRVITVTISGTDDAPIITSNGGGASAAISIQERTTAVTTVTSSDVDGGTAVYSIVVGGDGALFSIDPGTGVLAFVTAPDFENPGDAGANNVYDLTVQVSDGAGGSDTQAIAVTVIDVADRIRVTPSVVPLGGETLVNTTTNGDQSSNLVVMQAVASDASGNYVVVWHGQNPGSGTGMDVYAQRFSADGTALGLEFQVNTIADNAQRMANVAMDAAGNFVIVWQSKHSDNTTGIYAQRYNAAGEAQGGEFRVFTTMAGSQDQPAIAMASDGSFVIACNSVNGTAIEIYAQRYNASGIAQGSEFRVNTFTAGAQNLPSVGMDAAGNFVITWTSANNQDGSGTGIFGQRYDVSGTARGSEFLVNSTIPGSQAYADVAMLADGRFVVVWQTDTLKEIYLQRYAADGSRLGGEIPVIALMVGSVSLPSVSADASGNIVVVWSHSPDGVGTEVYGRRLDWSGTALGGEFQVNTTTAGAQSPGEVVAQPGGGFVVVWVGNGTGDPDGIFMQRYGLSTTEAGGTATFEVVLEAAPTADVVIPVSVPDATEGTVSVASLTFTSGNWNLAQTVTVTGIQDYTNDGDVAYIVVLGTATSADPNFNGLNPADLRFTNFEVANIAPVNVVPGAQTVDEDTAKVFSSGNGNLISISDVDAGTNIVQVALSVTNGMLTLAAGFSGLNFSAGDGTASASMTFTGTIANINTALDGLRFDPTADFSGAVLLTIDTNDLGNSGSGGSQADIDTVSITVNAVNDAPTLSATALNPGFMEAAGLGTQAAAVSVFGGAAVSTVEAGQTITGLSFTVSGLVDGANEVIVVDGRTITLGETGSGTTVTNSLAYSATVSTGTATVVLSGGSLSAAATQTLVNGITYQNTNTDNPTAGIRVITLTQISDDGGTANAGADTRALSVNSTVMVNAVNDAPVLAAIGNQSINEGATLSFIASATDADVPANTLTYSLDAASLALGMSINATSGVFSWTPSEAQGGTAPLVTITVTDNGSGSLTDSETFSIAVNDTNVAPVLAAIGNQSINEGATLSFIASATDADLPAQSLSYSLDAASLALGMTINSSTGTFSWTPSEAQGGTAPLVTITVTDDGSGSLTDSETFTITVGDTNDAPVLAAIGNQSINEGATLTFTASATDADLPSQTLTYSLDATSLGLGMSINSSTGIFSWTPTEAQGGLTPSVTITVTDNGSGNLSDSETFTIIVGDINDAPVLAAIGNQSINEGATLSFTASATDADLPSQMLTYSLDATSLGLGMSINGSTGAFSWTPSEAQGGLTPSVTITVTDNGSGSLTDSETFSIAVNDTNVAPVLAAIGNQSINEGATLSLIASATDADLPAAQA